MCGRYTIFTDDGVDEMREILSEIHALYRNSADHAALKIAEICPADTAPALVLRGGEPHAQLMKWGFPKWQGSGVIINARAETVQEKPTFRTLLESRRCVIPSTGFYEWKHAGGKTLKEKYRIRLSGRAMLYMAGLYNTFTDGLGRPYTAFVILTTAASQSIAPLHDRMPLMLEGEARHAWLRDYGAAMQLLYASRDDALELIPENPQQQSFL